MDISPQCQMQRITDSIIMQSKNEKSLSLRGYFPLSLSLNDNESTL